jgi:hypothetical protein
MPGRYTISSDPKPDSGDPTATIFSVAGKRFSVSAGSPISAAGYDHAGFSGACGPGFGVSEHEGIASEDCNHRNRLTCHEHRAQGRCKRR